MRIVPPQNVTGNLRCAITERTSDPDGFISTGRKLNGWDQPVDISIAAAKEMARMLGWHSPEAVEAIKDRLKVLENEFKTSLDRIDKLTRLRELEAEITEDPS